MRSSGEVLYRLRQEIANLVLLCAPPRLNLEVSSPLPGLPDPELIKAKLKGSRLETELDIASREILSGRYRFLGLDLSLGPQLRWRTDPVHERESSLRYFRRIPYLDQSVGDHKIIWELNRHQHLVTLAQAHVLSGRPELITELVRQLESWMEANPYQRGINWTSALEVAFRAFSWIWIYHLAGRSLPASLRKKLLHGLYLHGCHLEYNLSVYFSPNTHLLGEAVALHALGALIPMLPRAARWANLGGQIVKQQLQRQVRKDGCHFEQSTYYHVYALDFFLFHYLVSGQPESWIPVLSAMATYLEAAMGPQRRLPWIGDDDGGRLFFPVGPKEEYGRATLATCSVLFGEPQGLQDKTDANEQALWWLGRCDPERPVRAVPACQSRLFADSGTVVLAAGDLWMLVKAGPFGALTGGHSHSDVLSIVARYGDEDILIDPGTYTYFEPEWRELFRGSAAHNTLRVNGRDQAVPRGQFAWSHKPSVHLESWSSNPDQDVLVASCRYGGADVFHRRRILFQKPHTIFILDEVTGPPPLKIEQFWHTGQAATRLSERAFRIGSRVGLATCSKADLLQGVGPGWRSRGYGSKEPSPVVSISQSAGAPALLATVLHCGEMPATAPELVVAKQGQEVLIKMGESGAAVEGRFVL